VRMERYAEVSRQVFAIFRRYSPLVEPLSIDEAFLDLTGCERLFGGPVEAARRLRADVRAELDLTASVGVAPNKFVAKIASDQDKPRGFFIIGRGEAQAFLDRQPVSIIWGVGPRLTAALARDGYDTVADLRHASRDHLISRYGEMGLRLYNLARGEDHRRVEAHQPAKSISAETTFDTDLTEAARLRERLWPLCEKVSARMKRAGLAGRTVTLKLKDRDFRPKTRNRQLAHPTQLADRIFRAALPLLEKELDGTAYRLLGVGVVDFADPARADPDDLIDLSAARRAKAERAVVALRGKFGERAVETGYTFGTDQRGRPQRDGDP